MPDGLVLSNLNGLRFVKGFLYAGIEGRTADAVTHGALQNIAINHAFEYAKLSGPESLAELAVGITKENLTFTASWGRVSVDHFSTYFGGQVTYDGATGKSTYTKYVNDEQPKVDLHLKTPADGSHLEVYLYGCIVETAPVIQNVANRQFHIGEISGQCYGEGSSPTSRLFRVIAPGNLTLSS